MALFLIEHHHTAETCPTRNPDMVRALRAHVTAENAQKMGLTLLADWANDDEHKVVLVVDSPTLQNADNFAAPFRQVGSVDIQIGGTCEDVAKACLGE
jgi:hypothetical protein